LDLHGAPGGQSGQHHSGRANPQWRPSMLRIDDSARILGEVSRLYCNRVEAIEVLNEPSWAIPAKQLLEYYRRTYEAIRAHGSTCTVVFSIFPAERHFDFAEDAFAGMTNIAFDVHFYQIFDPWWQSTSLPALLSIVRYQREYDIQTIERKFGPVSVGEWSGAMPWHSWLAPYPSRRDSERHPQGIKDAAKKFFLCTQLHMVTSASKGSYYWSWETKGSGVWSVQYVLNQSWLNTTWRDEDCAGITLNKSKLDTATNFTFFGVFPCICCLSLTLCLYVPPHAAEPAPSWRSSDRKCVLRSVTARSWWFVILLIRISDLCSPVFLLPVFPSESMEEIVEHTEDRNDEIHQWWYVVVGCAWVRAIIAFAAYCKAPADERVHALVLHFRQGTPPSMARHWLTTMFLASSLVRILLAVVLMRLAVHSIGGILWPVGHPLWQTAACSLMSSLLLASAEGAHACMHRCKNSRWALFFGMVSSMCNLLIVLWLFFSIYFIGGRLLGSHLPVIRHWQGWLGLQLDNLIQSEARTR